MKVGVDCSPIMYKKTGVGNYVHNLLLNLAKIDTINSYVLFLQSLTHLDSEKTVRYEFAHKKTVAIRAPKPLLDFFWYKLRFTSIDAFIGKVDIFHSNFYSPRIRKAKSVLTVYDMSFASYPDLQTTAVQRFYPKVRESCNKALKVITISNFSKAEILKFLDIPEEKVEVIYPGVIVNEPKCSNSDEEKLLSKYQLSGSYVLFVGTIEPRKNIAAIVKAFEILLQKYKYRCELVIVGKLGWKYEECLRKIRGSRAQSRIRMLGYVPDDDLPIIYKHASVFVYPSVYEGFGLPVLEAMAYDTPVITSNVSSLPEIAGDAALLVNPYDEGQIAEAMDKVMRDPEQRRQLIERGREQVKKYSWMETARRTLELYEQVYNEK